MSDSFEPKRDSKLHAFARSVMDAVRGERPRSSQPSRSSVPSGSKASAPQSKSRTWDPDEWEEDQRYVAAMDLLLLGRKRDALQKLQQLHEDDPGHLPARQQIFNLSIELKDKAQLVKHAEWMVCHALEQGEAQQACDAYREARTALPELSWAERVLIQTLIAGDKVKDSPVVIDTSSLLLRNYPQSQALPRAFLATATAQEAQGQPDLAKVTLQHLIARFPLDPLVQLAERKLAKLEQEGY